MDGEWIEMQPIVDEVVFGDQDEPGFDRARACRAMLAGVNDLELDEVRVELGERYVLGLDRTVPIIKWWAWAAMPPRQEPVARLLG